MQLGLFEWTPSTEIPKDILQIWNQEFVDEINISRENIRKAIFQCERFWAIIDTKDQAIQRLIFQKMKLQTRKAKLYLKQEAELQKLRNQLQELTKVLEQQAVGKNTITDVVQILNSI